MGGLVRSDERRDFLKVRIANVSTGTGFQKSLNSSFQSETDAAISAWQRCFFICMGSASLMLVKKLRFSLKRIVKFSVV